MSCCCLSPDRVKLIVISRVKMGCCCLPPGWVKLTVNSKKEINSRVKMGRVKMGQGSRLASVIYPLKESKWDKSHYELLLFIPWQSQTNSEQQGQNGLLLFTPCLSQTNSEQQERNKQQGQMGQQSRWASVTYPLKESKWGFCCLPPDRVKLAMNSKKEKQTAGSKWAKS